MGINLEPCLGILQASILRTSGHVAKCMTLKYSVVLTKHFNSKIKAAIEQHNASGEHLPYNTICITTDLCTIWETLRKLASLFSLWWEHVPKSLPIIPLLFRNTEWRTSSCEYTKLWHWFVLGIIYSSLMCFNPEDHQLYFYNNYILKKGWLSSW